jgi:hypothetical protein
MGKPTDAGISGDWNHDGTTEIGLRRTSLFYLDYNGNGKYNGPTDDRLYNMGKATDLPVTGDWNADGTTEIGIQRAGNSFFLDYSGNGKYDGAVIDRLYSAFSTGTPVSGKW